jgi:hypothetical protein
MRIASILVIAAMAIFCLPIFAQDIEYVSSVMHTGPLLTIEVLGDTAYCAGEYSFNIISVENPNTPNIVGSCAIPSGGFYSGSNRLVVRGNFAYVVCGGEGIQVIDITNPTTPFITGSCDTPGGAAGLFVSGDYAYIADWSSLQIINISDPSTPWIEGNCETGNGSYRVCENNGYAFIANSNVGLIIVDVSEPDQAEIVMIFSTIGRANDVCILENHAYVAEYDPGGIEVVDISNPEIPQLRGYYYTPNWATCIAVRNELAYLGGAVLNWYDTVVMEIIDISDLNNPELVGCYYDYGYDIEDIDLEHETAFFAKREVGGSGNIYFVDVSVPSNPTFLNYFDVSRIIDVYKSGDYAFAVNYNLGLQVIDISDPYNPSYITGLNLPGDWAKDIFISDNYAYMIDSIDSTLFIIDISIPSDPQMMSSLNVSDRLEHVFVSDNLAYIADYNYGIHVIDVTEPEYPTYLSGFEMGMSGTSEIIVAGENAYVLNRGVGYGLYILNITNPESLYLESSWDAPDRPYCMAKYNDYIYISLGSSIQIVNVSDPLNPTHVDSFNIQNINDLFVDENYLYVACNTSIHVFNISDPEEPIWTAAYSDISFNRWGSIFVSEYYIYLSHIMSLMIFHFDPEMGIDLVLEIPTQYSLEQNYPNPFNISTLIKYELPNQSQVTIDIYDILGRKVTTVENAVQPAGYHEVIWNAGALPSGVYFYKLQAGNFSESNKMILLK